ncbi:MAG: mechanosensitive ion channel [Oceanicaulis sp.]|uniref:mechanosensitive ion channel family protein n=1 Tax=Glycocaulis sp. TaxID=1969725 RepID=UPI0025C3E787|nr:mechanosensitive ion channel domain-containing protein [Glycocaulis sp.]MCC5982192.1 mechanosensitive ion channel [Oceanicaulis sp.]MCH8520382.1 mechanosensitive ion channel [Glycocaulis sp.]
MEFGAELDGQIDNIFQYLTTLGVAVLSNVALAAIILVAGLYTAGFVSRRVRKWAIAHPRIDTTLALFFASVVRYVIVAVVVIAVLTRFGVETTSLVAALGAMTLAVGLALQGTLSNVAAGVMIVFFRPYKIGDFVDIGGTAGTVHDINLFYTELNTPDNRQVIVPNAQSWGRVIVNFSGYNTRRVDFMFTAAYGADMEQVRSVIRRVLEDDERVLAEPPVVVEVAGHGASAVEYTARAWVNTLDYWPYYWEKMRLMKQAFDNEGIEIPYPHQVHIKKEG